MRRAETQEIRSTRNPACGLLVGALLAILLLLLFDLPLTAAAKTSPVEITFWHVWGGARIPLVEQQIKEFEERFPGIKVNHELISAQGMMEKYLAAMAGGMPPDVIMIHGRDHLPAFAARKALIELDKYMERDGIQASDVWYKAEYETYQWQGKTYALPFATGTGFFLLFYNKGHFKDAGLDPNRPPRTWSQVEEYTKRLTVRKGDDFERIGFDPAQGCTVANYIFREWLFLNDGHVISPDGRKILFNSPEGVETLKWLVRFYDSQYGGYDKVRAIVSGPGPAPYREAFQLGKVSMLVDGVWLPLTISKDAPHIDYGIAVMPYNDRNPKARLRNIVEGGWGYAIPKGAKHPDEAWEWLKWTCIDKGNLDFFKAQLRPSPVIKLNNDPFFAKSSPFWGIIQESLEKSEYSPASPVQSKLNEITMQMLEEALLRRRTPEDAIKWAASESQKVLDDWWARAR